MSSIYQRIRQLAVANPGWSQHRIARELGLYEHRVRSELQRMYQGLPPGPTPQTHRNQHSAKELIWTTERVERLKTDWMNGLSASQCAARLGCLQHCADGGRSAVIGKVHRLGLATRTSPRRKTTVRKPRDAARTYLRPRVSELERAIRATKLMEAAERIENQAGPDLFIPPSERKTLAQLADRGECKWPYGTGTKDDPYYFCGKRQIAGLPYCDFHAKRAVQPVQPPGVKVCPRLNEPPSVHEPSEMERA